MMFGRDILRRKTIRELNHSRTAKHNRQQARHFVVWSDKDRWFCSDPFWDRLEATEYARTGPETAVVVCEVPLALLDTDEAARVLGMSPRYLEALRGRGGGPPFVRIGRTVRYQPEALDAWIKQRVQWVTSDDPE